MHWPDALLYCLVFVISALSDVFLNMFQFEISMSFLVYCFMNENLTLFFELFSDESACKPDRSIP